MKSKTLFNRIFGTLFDFEHILTPIAVEHIQRDYGAGNKQTYRLVYVFGIRVGFYATTRFWNT